MSVTLESITEKVRASKPVYDRAGVRITLTNQQRSVLVYTCRCGMTIKEMARELGESFHTLKHIYSSVMKLSRCRNQGQLGAWAAKQGLV